MAGSIDTNAAAAAARLQRVREALRLEVQQERATLAARIAAEMRRRAPKGARTTLANSIMVETPDADTHVIRPTVAYAYNVEHGRKPGKGLPRFFDPAAASAVAWLESKIAGAARATNPKYRRGAGGTARFTAEELALRDRYFAFSRAVKLRGIKASPFVKPTADLYRPIAHAAIVAAVQRATVTLRGGAA